MSQQWITIANFATPVITALIGFMFRQWMGRVTDRVGRIEKDMIELQQERLRDAALADTRHATVGQQFTTMRDDTVRREDWIRETSRVRQTLEKVVVEIARLDGKLDAGTRIATSLDQLADAMRKDGDDGR